MKILDKAPITAKQMAQFGVIIAGLAYSGIEGEYAEFSAGQFTVKCKNTPERIANLGKRLSLAKKDGGVLATKPRKLQEIIEPV